MASLLAVFVLLGGAGLAVAADGPSAAANEQADAARAEAAAAPLVAALETALADVRQPLAAVAGPGREAVGRLQSLDIDGMQESIGAGNAAYPVLTSALAAVEVARDQAAAGVDMSRVGAATAERLQELLAASDATAFVPDSWRLLTTRALLVGNLVDSITNHEAAVFNATEFGRAGQWDNALSRLEQAGGALSEAAAIRNQLTPATPTPTLDNLLVRYAAYNAALTDLYTYMRHSGDRSTDEFGRCSPRSPWLRPRSRARRRSLTSSSTKPPAPPSPRISRPSSPRSRQSRRPANE